MPLLLLPALALLFSAARAWAEPCPPIVAPELPPLETLIANSTTAFRKGAGDPGCARERPFPPPGYAGPRSCAENARSIEKFADRCLDVTVRHDPRDRLSLLLRREQLKFEFDHELSLMSRLSGNSSGYESAWASFRERWECRAGMRTPAPPRCLALHEPELMRLDASESISPDDRGALALRIRALPQAQAGLKAAFSSVSAATGLSKITLYDLIRASVLLRSLDSQAARAWAARQTGRAAPKDPAQAARDVTYVRSRVADDRVRFALTEEKNFLFATYPELERDSGLLRKISRLLDRSGFDQRLVENRLYAEQGSRLELSLETINRELGRTVGSGTRANGELAAIERSFAKAMQSHMTEMEADIQDARRDPATLYGNAIYVDSAINTASPLQAGIIEAPLASLFCGEEHKETVREERLRKAMLVGAGLLVVTGVGALAGTALSVSALAMGANAVGMVAGLSLSAGNVVLSASQYNQTRKYFYTGLVTHSELEQARSARSEAASWFAVNLATMGYSSALQGARGAAEAAQAAGDLERAARLGKTAQVMTTVDRGIQVGFTGFNVEQGNWLGLGLQLSSHGQQRLQQRNGLRVPVSAPPSNP